MVLKVSSKSRIYYSTDTNQQNMPKTLTGELLLTWLNNVIVEQYRLKVVLLSIK